MSDQTQISVQRGPISSVLARPLLRRACGCGDHTPGGSQCESCKTDSLQRSPVDNSTLGQAPPSVYQVLRSPGQPLDRSTRQAVEPLFGHDFSNVRVHADESAARSAAEVSASAWTYGRDIAFGNGMYSPSSPRGAGLLAHELSHVVQQKGLTRSSGAIEIGPAADSHEHDADANRQAVLSGGLAHAATSASGPRLQRSAASALADAASAVGTALKDVALFIPRLFGLSAGYSADELKDYLKGLKDRKGPENGIFSDNKARACVSRETELGPYDLQTKIWLIQEMLGGYTSVFDEGSIIDLIRHSKEEVPQIVSAIGRDNLWKKFSGQNRRIIEALTMTASDAGDGLVDRLRNLDRDEINDYAANAVDPAVKESARKAAALANITTPAPSTAAINQAGQADFTINGVRVTVLPDQINPSLGNHGFTHSKFSFSGPGEITVTAENANQPVGTVGSVEVSVELWTEFPSEESKQGASGYGAGRTLQEHERAHGKGWLDFLKNNPPPAFSGAAGMTVTQLNPAVQQWNAAIRDYGKKAGDYSQKVGDCVGKLPTDEQLRGTGFTAAICNTP